MWSPLEVGKSMFQFLWLPNIPIVIKAPACILIFWVLLQFRLWLNNRENIEGFKDIRGEDIDEKCSLPFCTYQELMEEYKNYVGSQNNKKVS